MPIIIFQNLGIISQMSKREIVAQYKGSIIGLGWSLFQPLFMLVIYTFVFTVIFKSRWGIENDTSSYTLLLFTGLTFFNYFSNIINRSPSLIWCHINLVKKVVFPIEVLPIIITITAAFHFAVNMVVLLAGIYFIQGTLHLTIFLLPILLVPLTIINLGLGWLLSSLGVYFRDLGQFIPILTSILMFLSPIFYPISAVPDRFQKAMMINPLSFIIEQARKILLFGEAPSWEGLALYTLCACLFSIVSYCLFQKLKKGFADVL